MTLTGRNLSSVDQQLLFFFALLIIFIALLPFDCLLDLLAEVAISSISVKELKFYSKRIILITEAGF